MLTTTKNPRTSRALPWFAALGLLFAACTPPGPKALLDGERLLNAGRPADAVRRLRAAVQYLPANPQAWNHLGLAYHRNRQPREALQAYQQALAVDRNLAVAHYNLGCLLLELGDANAAAETLRTFVSLQNQSGSGWRMLGQAQLRTGQWDRADQSFRTALRVDPNDLEALNGLGIVHQQRRQFREAWNCFSSAVQRDPDFAPAWLNLAVAAHRVGATPQAIQAYQRYALLRPEPARIAGIPGVISTLQSLPAPTPPPPSPALLSHPQSSTPPNPAAPDPLLATTANPAPSPAPRSTASPNPTPIPSAPTPSRPQESPSTPFTASSPAPAPTPQPKPDPELRPAPPTSPIVVAQASPGSAASPSPSPAQSPRPAPSLPPSRPNPRPPTPNPHTVNLPDSPTAGSRPPALTMPVFPASTADAPSPVPTETPDATTPTAFPPATSEPPPLVRPIYAQRGTPVSPSGRRGFWDRANPANWFRREGENPEVDPLAPGEALQEPNPIEAEPTVPSGAPLLTGPTIRVVTSPPAPAPEPAPAPRESARPAYAFASRTSPRDFRRYIYLNPEAPSPGNRSAARPFLEEALLEHRRGRLDGAIDLYQQALRLDPAAFEAHQNLAVARLQLGDIPRALSAAETALALRPDSAAARLNLALALDQGGFPTDAATEAQRIVEAAPDDIAAHLLLGNLYSQKLADPVRARIHYLRVIDLNPQHPQSVAIRRWLASGSE